MLKGFFLTSIKNIGYICRPFASVAELVDAPDSKSGSARSVGSIPTRGTIKTQITTLGFFIKNAFLSHSIYIELRYKTPYQRSGILSLITGGKPIMPTAYVFVMRYRNTRIPMIINILFNGHTTAGI